MDIDARAFGQLEGKVEALTLAMAEQNKVLESQNKKMDAMAAQLAAIGTQMSEARGGWKTLLWIGGASASAAGLVTWVLQNLSIKGGS